MADQRRPSNSSDSNSDQLKSKVRKQVAMFVYAFGLLALIAAMWFVPTRLVSDFFGNPSAAIVFATMLLVGFAGFVMEYLQRSSKPLSSTSHPQRQATSKRVTLGRLLKAVEEANNRSAKAINSTMLGALPAKERASFVDNLTQSIQQTLSTAFISTLESKYGQTIGQSEARAEVRQLFARTTKRLDTEVLALSRRANVNLVIGMTTTFFAVVLLSIAVLSKPEGTANVGAILLHFVPKLSVAIFVETFSFFFLRLYKGCLADIKYYQNELTSVESRFLSLDASLSRSTPPEAIPILSELSKTDRNRDLNGLAVAEGKADDKTSGAMTTKELHALLSQVAALAKVASPG